MMKKRHFRHEPVQAPKAEYPTADEFDGSRREFLARFGATILGASTLAAAVGCGDGRAINQNAKPDAGHLSGGAPAPDAKVDPVREDGPSPGCGATPSSVAQEQLANEDVKLVQASSKHWAGQDHGRQGGRSGVAPPVRPRVAQAAVAEPEPRRKERLHRPKANS